MRTVVVRNLHQALIEEAYQLVHFGVGEGSHRTLPVPLTTLVIQPTERVTFHSERDTNPFFNLFTSLWVLSGRDDLSFLDVFGITYPPTDPLTRNDIRNVIQALGQDPTDKRQYLGLYDRIYVQVDLDGKIQVMATNRSYSLGCLEGNAVFLSMLQEYIATALHREVGLLYFVSFDVHRDLSQIEELAKKSPYPDPPTCPYTEGAVTPTVPLMSLPRGRWDRELDTFAVQQEEGTYVDPFFLHVAVPLYSAYKAFRSTSATRFDEAHQFVGQCASQDWMLACRDWLLAQQAK